MKTHTPVESQRWVAGMTPLAVVDPLAGADVLGVPTVYWERPLAQDAAAGWGEAAVVEAQDASDIPDVLASLGRTQVRWLGEAPESMPGPWFGGIRFGDSGTVDTAWASHGVTRWTLPEVLVFRTARGACVVAFAQEGRGGEDLVRSRLERVRACFPESYRHARGEPVELELRASRPDFEVRVQRALDAIASGHLQKVVLARPLDAEGPAPFDVVDVLARLREQNPRCATFLFRAPDDTCFLGATPETLCRVDGQVLETEALAGTAAPGQADGLRGHDKNVREHASVVRYLVTALTPLAEQVSSDAEPALLALKNVVHLRTGFRAELRPGVTPAQVVEALHPTPAVGGTPRERALSFLVEHEGLDRGWYAGPVGWVGPGRAHLMVALRSARVKGAKARLFVGVGLVAGSNADSEWRETEMKSLAMLRALGGGDVVRR